jgi:hypothetical protein
MMTELEMSRKLGLILEPVKNRLRVNTENETAMGGLIAALFEQAEQKILMDGLFEETWLDFVPWHSDN